MTRLDNITNLFGEVEGTRHQHIVADMLIVESHAISNLRVRDEVVISFDLQDYTRSVTYRVAYDAKSVTFSSILQNGVQGASYLHSLYFTTAGTYAKPTALATKVNSNKFFVFYKLSDDKWYMLPTYAGADVKISYEKFPSRATLRCSSQAKESQMQVDEELLEFLNMSFRLPEQPIIVAL